MSVRSTLQGLSNRGGKLGGELVLTWDQKGLGQDHRTWWQCRYLRGCQECGVGRVEVIAGSRCGAVVINAQGNCCNISEWLALHDRRFLCAVLMCASTRAQEYEKADQILLRQVTKLLGLPMERCDSGG